MCGSYLTIYYTRIYILYFYKVKEMILLHLFNFISQNLISAILLHKTDYHSIFITTARYSIYTEKCVIHQDEPKSYALSESERIFVLSCSVLSQFVFSRELPFVKVDYFCQCPRTASNSGLYSTAI